MASRRRHHVGGLEGAGEAAPYAPCLVVAAVLVGVCGLGRRADEVLVGRVRVLGESALADAGYPEQLLACLQETSILDLLWPHLP